MDDTAKPRKGSFGPHIIPGGGVKGLVGGTHDRKFLTGTAAAAPAPPKISKHVLKRTCPFCANTYRSRRQLIIHKRLHTGERPFKCYLCSKAYASRRSLVVHERKHSNPPTPSSTGGRPETGDTVDGIGEARPRNEKRLKCDSCSKLFWASTELKRHMEVHKSDEDKTHACNLCTASFFKPGGLASHLRNTHSTPSAATSEACFLSQKRECR